MSIRMLLIGADSTDSVPMESVGCIHILGSEPAWVCDLVRDVQSLVLRVECHLNGHSSCEISSLNV